MTSKNPESNDLLNELGRQVTEIGTKAVGLPKRLDENLERLEQGDLQLQVRMGESDRQLRRMINAQQTLSNSVLGDTSTPSSSGVTVASGFRFAFIIFGSEAYRGSFRRRSLVTMAGSSSETV